MFYLRLSLTDRCNLRCTYCLPENARFAPDRCSTTETHTLVQAIHDSVGLLKIRLTGGEPTLVDDLVEHVAFARSLVPTVGLTSNGILLEPLLPALFDAGLNRINISLDTINSQHFKTITRRTGVEKVISSIRAAKRAGFDPVKVNAVATQNTDYPMMTQFAIDEGIHMRFIELMAIGEALPWQEQAYISAEGMRERMRTAGYALSECTERDEPTARIWTIDGTDPFDASLGFITTTTNPFCDTCNRLRLTSEGKLYTCLMDNTGCDLITPLRDGVSQQQLHELIADYVGQKAPPEQFIRYGDMAAIGG